MAVTSITASAAALGLKAASTGAATQTGAPNAPISPSAPAVLDLSLVQATQLEGDSGARTYVGLVTRRGPLTATVSVQWDVRATGTSAVDAADFVGGAFPSATVTLLPGDTTASFTFAVAGDTTVEPDETFLVALSNPFGAILGVSSVVGTITNDDAAVVPRVPTSVTFTPATSFAPTVGDPAFAVTATILDQFGAAIGGATGTWASQSTAVATLTQAGLTATVTPVAEGQAVLSFTVVRSGQADLVATVQVGVAAAGSTTVAYTKPTYPRPSIPAATTDYYIDAQNGSDSNPGTAGQPWRSLSKTVGYAGAGVRFNLAGTFPLNEQVTINGYDDANPGANGNASAWCTVRNWPGRSHTLQVSNGNYNNTAFNLLDVQYWSLENLNIVGYQGAGYGIYLASCNNIRILDSSLVGADADNTLYHSGISVVGNGKRGQPHHIWIDGNYIDKIGDKFGLSPNEGDGIVLVEGAYNVTVVRNDIRLCGHVGITLGSSGTLDLEQWTVDTGVRYCVVALNYFRNDWAGSISLNGYNNHNVVEWNTVDRPGILSQGAGSEAGIFVVGLNNVVRRNVVTGAVREGIKLQCFNYPSGRRHTCVGNQVYHNTVTNCGGPALSIVTQGSLNPELTVQGNVIQNNLFWGNAGDLGSDFGNNHCQVLIVLGSASDAEWARWFGNGAWPMNGNVVQNNSWGRATADQYFLFMSPRGGFGEFSNPYTLADAKLTSRFGAMLKATNTQSTVDPLFANTTADLSNAATNYALASGSPVRDAGAILGGYAYLGTAPDLGARES